MGNCHTKIQKVIFDFEDEQITKVRVEIDFEGDCPIQIKRAYEKSFPARIAAIDLLTMEDGVLGYLFW